VTPRAGRSAAARVASPPRVDTLSLVKRPLATICLALALPAAVHATALDTAQARMDPRTGSERGWAAPGAFCTAARCRPRAASAWQGAAFAGAVLACGCAARRRRGPDA
jgi:hypothetical protein